MENTARRLIPLEDIRADGWFEQLGEEVPEFEQLCEVVGQRFLAFSFVAGVRISSVAYDPQSPHSSLVDFTLGAGDDPQQMSLSDLRERLGAALLSVDEDEEEEEDLPPEPTSDDLRRHIGRRYLLLAPVFGLALESIEVGGGSEPMVRLKLGGSIEALSVQGLRDVIHNAIRSEVARSRPSQAFSIDFKKVPAAEAANEKGDYDETIALLGSWPGPLSMFLRTPQGQALGAAERGKLVRALCALGDAYLHKRQGEWAEDVLRLGIQFGQELPAAAPLFGLLGRARMQAERYGEAIGLYRRAIGLGGDKRELLPQLARCFVERKRFVAAMACLDEAAAQGTDPELLRDIELRVKEALGPALERYRDFVTG